MTWKHVAIICAAILCVVVCGGSERCAGSIKEVIGLASIICVGVLGHAKENAEPRPKPVPAVAEKPDVDRR